MRGAFRVIGLGCAVVLACTVAFPCSVFNFTDSSGTRVGRNLDWLATSSGWIRFMQPTDQGYGAVFFGADNHVWPQGGMNDQGLVLGMAATPYLEITGNPDGLPMGQDFWELLFSTCATVPEVLDFLALYNLGSIAGYMEQGHMLWTDRNGDSAIVEGDVTLNGSGSYQVITNFLHSRPDLGGWPCGRYDTIVQMLDGQGDLSDLYLESVIEAAHGTIWGGYTVWSLLYHPEILQFTVYYRGDFDYGITIDLPSELAAGTQEYLMDELFDPAHRVFADGFESGDTSAWSQTIPAGDVNQAPRRILGIRQITRGSCSR